jgi:hypothetical protein
VKLLKGKRLKSVLVAGFSGGACFVVYFPVPGQHQFDSLCSVREGDLAFGKSVIALAQASELD